MQRCSVLFIVGLVACSPGEDEGFSRFIEPQEDEGFLEPEPRCPDEMIFIPGGTNVSLGDPTGGIGYNPDVTRLLTYPEIDGFCFDAFPFPGEGYFAPTAPGIGALNYGEVQEIAEVLPAFNGRRLCTYAEFLFASAGTENRRYPWGETFEGTACEPNPDFPTTPIGSFPDCVTPEGAYDILVRSAWVTIDDITHAQMEEDYVVPLDPGDLMVTGKYTPNFSSPDNWGRHCHVIACGTYDQGQFPGNDWPDDGLRLCADPVRIQTQTETQYKDLRAQFADSENYRLFFE